MSAAVVSRFDRDQAKRLVPVVIAAHLAVLGYVVLTRYFALPGRETGFAMVQASVVNWDAEHYLKIAERGYCEPYLSVFFPLYPWSVALVSWLVGSVVTASLVVSGAMHVLAACLLYLLASLDETPAVARRAVLFFLAYPVAFACVLPYTESLFLAVLLGSVLCFRTGRFGWAGVIGALCTATRITGMALVGYYAIEALLRPDVRKRALMAAVLASLGFGCYLLVNQTSYGSPIFFTQQIQAGFSKHLVLWPPVGLQQAWGSLSRPAPQNITVGFCDLLGAALAWTATIYSFRRLGRGYGVFCLLTALLLTTQSWWLSTLRYSFAIFPVHLMLARVSEREWVRMALLGACLVLQALLASQYARGAWAI